MKCYFCHLTGMTPSREHVISKPIAAAVGISRTDDYLAELDGNTGKIQIPPAPFNAHTVKAPCERCNNGWMSKLEEEMAEVLNRVRAGEREVTPDDWRTVARWLLKTYIVYGLRSAHFHRPFTGTGSKSGLIHNPRQANELALSNESALQDLTLGYAKHARGGLFTAFGSAHGPAELRRFVGAFAIGFEGLDLQLWIVNPVLPVTVRLPQRVKLLEPGTSREERASGTRLDPLSVRFSA